MSDADVPAADGNPAAAAPEAPAPDAPAPQTEGPDEHERVQTTDAIALIAAIVLGLAAILTAWGSYKASLAGGEVTQKYAEQQALIAQANDTYAQSDQASQLEQQFFLSYAINAAQDNTGATTYLESTMPDDLAAVVKWWADQPAETIPPTPFVDQNPAYASLNSQVLLDQGNQTMADSEVARVAAEEANNLGDRFGLANVFFAIVLFLAGVATLLSRRYLQLGVLGLGVVILGVGLFILVTTSGWATLG